MLLTRHVINHFKSRTPNVANIKAFARERSAASVASADTKQTVGIRVKRPPDLSGYARILMSLSRTVTHEYSLFFFQIIISMFIRRVISEQRNIDSFYFILPVYTALN